MSQLRQLKPQKNGEPKSKEKKKASPRVSLAGATRLLQSNRSWTNVLAYNERTAELVFMKQPPCATAHKGFPAAVVDADFTSIVLWFDGALGLTAAYDTSFKASLRAGTLRGFDPVRGYLDGLKWDGTERIHDWLPCYFGAEDSDWTRAIGPRWLISAVARVYDPGCQVDSILIAEGPQGIGKSSGFRALAVRDDWFACDLPDIKSKDAIHHLLGPWIVELSELDALNRKEASAIKSFVSTRFDRARLSYGRLSTNHPRRMVFCGSTNESAYNSDATGGRRFWPFEVKERIDPAVIARDRDQLWAEAVVRYKRREPFHLDNADLVKLATREQRKRYKAGTWLEPIEKHADACRINPGYVTAADILANVLGVELGQQNQIAQNEVSRCLKHMGWRRKQVREGVRRVWVYVPPLSPVSPVEEVTSGDENP